jgi:DinB superfamily
MKNMFGFAAKSSKAVRISIFAPTAAKAPGSGKIKNDYMPLSSSIAGRLQHQHQSIREIVAGLPDDFLRKTIIPGKWSAHANIAHLTAYQPVMIDRLERISRDPSPAFGRYVAEEDPLFTDCLDRPVSSLLDQIDADRDTILAICTDGGESFLARTASHPRFGVLTVSGWMEFYLLHEAHHLYTIFSLVHSTESPHASSTPRHQ